MIWRDLLLPITNDPKYKVDVSPADQSVSVWA